MNFRPVCPRCHQGKLYQGFTTLRDVCEACGLNLKENDAADGPAYFGIVIVGFTVTFLAFYVEMAYRPPYWLHAALWLPLITVMSLAVIRLSKTALMHEQWKRREK